MSDARAPVCPDSAGDRPLVPSVTPSELHCSVTNDGERSLVLYISSLSLESVVSAETSLEALFWGLCRKVYSIPLDLPPIPPKAFSSGALESGDPGGQPLPLPASWVVGLAIFSALTRSSVYLHLSQRSGFYGLTRGGSEEGPVSILHRPRIFHPSFHSLSVYFLLLAKSPGC